SAALAGEDNVRETRVLYGKIRAQICISDHLLQIPPFALKFVTGRSGAFNPAIMHEGGNLVERDVFNVAASTVNRRPGQKIGLPFARDLSAEDHGAEICNSEFALVKGYVPGKLNARRIPNRKLFNGYFSGCTCLQQIR